MRKGTCSRPVVQVVWSVVLLAVLGAPAGFGDTLPSFTPLDMPTTEAPARDGPDVVILRPTLGDVVKGTNFPLAVQFIAGKHKLVLIELLVDDRVVGRLDEKGIAAFVNSNNQAMFTWDTTRVKDGIRKLTVRVTDSENLRGSASVRVAVMNMTVDKRAPMVSFLEPRNSVVRGRVEVVVQAKDDFGVKSVTVYLGSSHFIESKGLFILPKGMEFYRFSLNTERYPNGTYFLYAEAEDFEGNRSMSAPLRLQFSNPAGLTQPDKLPFFNEIIKPTPSPDDGDSMMRPVSPDGNRLPDRPMPSGLRITQGLHGLLGPLLTMQFSTIPADQSSGLSEPPLHARRVQPYALPPAPRLSVKITMSYQPYLPLMGLGRDNIEIGMREKNPLPHLVSRPGAQGIPGLMAPAKPSAARSRATRDVSIQPQKDLPERLQRSTQKPSPPAFALRPTPERTRSARPATPQMTSAGGMRVPVDTEPSAPSLEQSPRAQDAHVESPSHSQHIATAPKTRDPMSTAVGAPSAVVAVPPATSFGTLPGRAMEHRVNAPHPSAPGGLESDKFQIRAVPTTETYIVKRGDSLASIAKQRRVSVAMIREVNAPHTLHRLKEGQKIIVPRHLPIFINGQQLTKENMGALVMDSIALAPFRHVFEQVGGFVDWNGQQRLVTGVKGTQHVQLHIGDPIALLNGEPVHLQAVPFIICGRTIVPIRFFEKALNFYVEWDRENGHFVMLPR